MAVKRISTGVVGLDEKMEGGVPEKAVTLICGRAGTMKSTLGYSVLFNAAKEGRRGIYITLEQNRQSLVDHMVKIGMDPREISGEGGIIIVDMARLRKEMDKKEMEGDINWPQSVLTTVSNYKMKYGCDIFVLDSMAALYSIAEIKNPRSDLFLFFDKLRELDVTTFLVSEMFEPDKLYFGQYGVEDFLSDGILHVEMEKDARNVNLYLGVVKMRMTAHDRAYYPLIVEHGGLEIVTD